jgi:predicted Fe-Mo cluster-binding NifX family protein
MKIACITEDGRTISQHFGRAPYYVVLTVENGQIVDREMRSKLGHQHFAAEEQPEAAGARHGTDAASHNRHTSMAEVIADCQVLLCQGMGFGAYQSMQQVGITPVVTDVSDVEEAALAYAEGRLVDHPERLH